MKKLVLCFVLLQFAVIAFAQSFNAPRVAEKLLPTTKQNVKSVMQTLGFTNVAMEKKAVAAAGGRILTIYSGFYNGIAPKCEVYFSEKRTPDMVSIQNAEYESSDILFARYQKANYTLVSNQTKPAYMNPEQRNRAILRWEKKTNNATIICISEIADVVHSNSISLIDLNSSFFKK